MHDLVKRARDCANGIGSFKSNRGDFGLLDDLADRIEAQAAEIARLRDALAFYADTSKYPAPLTGGAGDLYFDCGQIARNALAATEKEPLR